jgi:hypothetical protein
VLCTTVPTVPVTVEARHDSPQLCVVAGGRPEDGAAPTGGVVNRAEGSRAIRTCADSCAARPGEPLAGWRREEGTVAERAVDREAAANRRACVGDGAEMWGLAMTIEAGAAFEPTCGQPRKATTALARTNTIAAPASNEPAVPNPAM